MVVNSLFLNKRNNGLEDKKVDENREIYLDRPLPEQEQSESSTKKLENAAPAKHQLYPLKSGSKNI